MINFVKILLIWTTILQIINSQQRQYQPVDVALVIDHHQISSTEFDPSADPSQIEKAAYEDWICVKDYGAEIVAYALRHPDWLHDTRVAVFLFDKGAASDPLAIEKFSERYKKGNESGRDSFYDYVFNFFYRNFSRITESHTPPYSVTSFGTIARQMHDAIQRPSTGNRPNVPDVVVWILHTPRRNIADADTIIRNRARLTKPCDNHAVNIFLVPRITLRFPNFLQCGFNLYGRSMDEQFSFRMVNGTPYDETALEIRRAMRLALSNIDQCSLPKTTIDPCAGSRETGQCYFDNGGHCKVWTPPECRTAACDRIKCEQRCNADHQLEFTKCDADCDADGQKTMWPARAAKGEGDYINCPKTKIQCSGIKCECTPVTEYLRECYFQSSEVCVIDVEMKAPSGISANARRHCQDSNLLGPGIQPCKKGAGECQRLCDNDRDRMTEECDAGCGLQGEIKSVPRNRPFCPSKVERTCTGQPCTCPWDKVVNTTIDCYFHDDRMCRKVIVHDWDPNMEERFRKRCPDDTPYECEKKKCDDKCNADEPYKDACVGECSKMGTRRVRSMKAVQNVQYYHNCPETTEPCFNNCTETTTRGTRPSTYTWSTRSTRTTKPTKASTKTTSTSISTTAKQVGAPTESPGVLETWHIILIVLLIVFIIVITVIVILIVTNRRKRHRRAIGHGYGGGARGRTSPAGRYDRSERGDKKKSPRDAGREQGRHVSRDRGQEHGRQIGRDRRDRSDGPSGGRTKPPSRESCQLSKTGKRTPPGARHGSRPPRSPRARSEGRRR